MRFEHLLRYDAAPEDVYAMLSEPEFRERVCRAQQATECSVDVQQGGAAMTVRVDQKRPADDIPGFARKFVGDHIHIRQEEDWTSPRDADLEVGIPGKPGHLRGTLTLRPDGEGTVETVSGEVKVNIPLVGGKLEGLIVELLEHALKSEKRVGREWLGGR
jgi:uncharacterized protein YndB with AHSA1/START domain